MFSVIIPVYNRQHLVTEALESVRSQSYRPIEIIVIDDGSSDDSVEVVKTWAKQYEEESTLTLKVFQQANAGAGAARNRGIQEATGNYIQFLDSDDRLHPDRLTRLAQTFEETGAEFIQTGFEGFDPDTGEIVQTKYARENQDQLELALYGFLWANTLRPAFTRELIDKTGLWDTEMICFEDREFVERALLHARKAVAIRDVLASARRGGSARISDLLRTYEGRRCRILCEERLAEGTRNRSDISEYGEASLRLQALPPRLPLQRIWLAQPRPLVRKDC